MIADSTPIPSKERAEEDELLRRFREDGDRAAFEELASRHAEAAYRVAHRLCGHRADAEDAVQEALLRAFTRAGSYRGEGPFRHWIVALTANACRDLARSARRRRERERVAAPPPPTDHAAPDLAEVARAELRALPERYRSPIALRYLDDLEYAEVAVALGLREGTVRMRVKRGLDLLRARLSRRRGVPIEPAAVAAMLALSGQRVPLGFDPLALARAVRPRLASTPMAMCAVAIALLTAGAISPAVYRDEPLPVPAAWSRPCLPAPTAPERCARITLGECLRRIAAERLARPAGTLHIAPAGAAGLAMVVDEGPLLPSSLLAARGVSLRWGRGGNVAVRIELADPDWSAVLRDPQREPRIARCHADVLELVLTMPDGAAALSGEVTYRFLATRPEEGQLYRVRIHCAQDPPQRWLGMERVEITFDRAEDADAPASDFRFDTAMLLPGD
jgi:RNA polymerase sigma-70 factor (ECF subfamily)